MKANEKHKSFIDEIQKGMKQNKEDIASDKTSSTAEEELIAEIERRFDELFGICGDEDSNNVKEPIKDTGNTATASISDGGNP